MSRSVKRKAYPQEATSAPNDDTVHEAAPPERTERAERAAAVVAEQGEKVRRAIEDPRKFPLFRQILAAANEAGILQQVVNSTNSEGTTALMEAAMHSVPEAVDLLVASGAVLNLCDEHGRTAMCLAAANNSTEVVRKLLAAGAVAAAPPLTVHDSHGPSVKAAAGKGKKQDHTELPGEVSEALKRTSPLVSAAAQGHYAAVSLIIHAVEGRSGTTLPELWYAELLSARDAALSEASASRTEIQALVANAIERLDARTHPRKPVRRPWKPSSATRSHEAPLTPSAEAGKRRQVSFGEVTPSLPAGVSSGHLPVTGRSRRFLSNGSSTLASLARGATRHISVWLGVGLGLSAPEQMQKSPSVKSSRV